MWSPRLKNVESKIAFLLQEVRYFETFGELILRKIIKIVAAVCQIEG